MNKKINDYYVLIDNEEVGPLSLNGLRKLWKDGTITAETLWCRPGMEEWLKIIEIQELIEKGLNKPAWDLGKILQLHTERFRNRYVDSSDYNTLRNEMVKGLVFWIIASFIALWICFHIMPSAKELEDNRKRLELGRKIYEDYHNLSGGAREYVDYVVTVEAKSSTKYFDRQYEEALSLPQSRFTFGVFFWGLVSVGCLGVAKYGVSDFRSKIKNDIS